MSSTEEKEEQLPLPIRQRTVSVETYNNAKTQLKLAEQLIIDIGKSWEIKLKAAEDRHSQELQRVYLSVINQNNSASSQPSGPPIGGLPEGVQECQNRIKELEMEISNLQLQLNMAEQMLSNQQRDYEAKLIARSQVLRRSSADTPHILNLNEDAVPVEWYVHYFQKDAKVVFGSGPDCVALNPAGVFPEHCSMQRQNGGAVVLTPIDLAPTFVNGKQVREPTPLVGGDRIIIGQNIFRFVDPQKPPEQATLFTPRTRKQSMYRKRSKSAINTGSRSARTRGLSGYLPREHTGALTSRGYHSARHKARSRSVTPQVFHSTTGIQLPQRLSQMEQAGSTTPPPHSDSSPRPSLGLTPELRPEECHTPPTQMLYRGDNHQQNTPLPPTTDPDTPAQSTTLPNHTTTNDAVVVTPNKPLASTFTDGQLIAAQIIGGGGKTGAFHLPGLSKPKAASQASSQTNSEDGTPPNQVMKADTAERANISPPKLQLEKIIAERDAASPPQRWSLPTKPFRHSSDVLAAVTRITSPGSGFTSVIQHNKSNRDTSPSKLVEARMRKLNSQTPRIVPVHMLPAPHGMEGTSPTPSDEKGKSARSAKSSSSSRKHAAAFDEEFDTESQDYYSSSCDEDDEEGDEEEEEQEQFTDWRKAIDELISEQQRLNRESTHMKVMKHDQLKVDLEGLKQEVLEKEHQRLQYKNREEIYQQYVLDSENIFSRLQMHTLISTPTRPVPTIDLSTPRYALEHTTQIWRFNVVLVGSKSCGKTSFLHTLFHKPKFMEKRALPDVRPTFGIDVHDKVLKAPTEKNKNVKVDVKFFDPSGDDLYRSHIFNLPEERVLYIYVWDTSVNLDEQNLKGWLESVQATAPAAPIILMGTHTDRLGASEKKIKAQMNNMQQVVKTYLQVLEPESGNRCPVAANFAISSKTRTLVELNNQSGSTKKSITDIQTHIAKICYLYCKADKTYPHAMFPQRVKNLAQAVNQVKAIGIWVVTGVQYRDIAQQVDDIFGEDAEELHRVTSLLNSWHIIAHFRGNVGLERQVFFDRKWVMQLTSSFAMYMHYSNKPQAIKQNALPFNVQEIQLHDRHNNLGRGIVTLPTAIALLRGLLKQIRLDDRDIVFCLDLLVKFDIIMPTLAPTTGDKVTPTRPCRGSQSKDQLQLLSAVRRVQRTPRVPSGSRAGMTKIKMGKAGKSMTRSRSEMSTASNRSASPASCASPFTPDRGYSPRDRYSPNRSASPAFQRATSLENMQRMLSQPNNSLPNLYSPFESPGQEDPFGYSTTDKLTDTTVEEEEVTCTDGVSEGTDIIYLVPSLFDGSLPSVVKQHFYGVLGGYHRRFMFNILPQNFFSRLVIRISTTVQNMFCGILHDPQQGKLKSALWKNGCWLSFGNNVRGLLETERRSLFFTTNSSSLRQTSDENMFLVGMRNAIQLLAQEYAGVTLEEFVPCVKPDCCYWFKVGTEVTPSMVNNNASALLGASGDGPGDSLVTDTGLEPKPLKLKTDLVCPACQTPLSSAHVWISHRTDTLDRQRKALTGIMEDEELGLSPSDTLYIQKVVDNHFSERELPSTSPIHTPSRDTATPSKSCLNTPTASIQKMLGASPTCKILNTPELSLIEKNEKASILDNVLELLSK